MEPKEVVLYRTQSGRVPLTEWIGHLRDRAGALRLLSRVERLSEGHLGDCRSVGQGVYELRFHFGPGYRIYFGERGGRLIILLCGGDKDTQQKDISLAKTYWADWCENLEE